jgi:2-polyprenyl-6-methoxyphenol hydroxylase-like FAD-dependent oxidoreductase
MNHYQAAIIGFGKAGKTLAAALGRAGWRVAIFAATLVFLSLRLNQAGSSGKREKTNGSIESTAAAAYDYF